LGLLLALGTGRAALAGEARQRARVQGAWSQATEFDPFIIIVSVIIIITITTTTVIFQHYFLKFIKEYLNKKANFPFGFIL